MGRERRKAKRHTVRYGAWFALAHGSLCECVLCGISETGARLMVHDTAVVPEKFVLVLTANGSAPPLQRDVAQFAAGRGEVRAKRRKRRNAAAETRRAEKRAC
jgi:hypothetical protein